MNKWDVRSRNEGTRGWLHFSEDVTSQTRQTAFAAYNDLARADVKLICLDFSATDYINSTGIGLIISLVETAIQHRWRVFTCGLNAHYQRLFTTVGLNERVTPITTVQEFGQISA
jgi:anti-anti-sigma factor